MKSLNSIAPKSLLGLRPVVKKEEIPMGRKEDEAFYARVRRRRRRTEIAKASKRNNREAKHGK